MENFRFSVFDDESELIEKKEDNTIAIEE